ncbi:MAG: hypothetical protein KAH48_12295 [Chlorobi bacterium]|nr:hypothetical protein [Chlorobiota bacterium]
MSKPNIFGRTLPLGSAQGTDLSLAERRGDPCVVALRIKLDFYRHRVSPGEHTGIAPTGLDDHVFPFGTFGVTQ